MTIASAPRTDRSLSGYRVLDLTVMTAGPVATMMFGDLGADVIKIEELHSGELCRSMGNIYIGSESVNFLSQNRNKRSVRLDLKSKAGRDATFLRMATRADVVTENFRPGTLDRLGAGYEVVRAVNPRIVFASVSAFGQTGPYAHLPANDPAIQALSGVMAMTGEAHGDPVRVGTPLPDLNTAGQLAFSVTAALLHRTIFGALPRDGETFVSGKAPPRLGSAHPSFCPYRNFRSAGVEIFFLACFSEKFWTSLCKALDRSDLEADPRTVNNIARCDNRDYVDAELQAEFDHHGIDELLALLAQYNVPAARVQDLRQALFEGPQARHNGTVVSVDHPTTGPFSMLALPINFYGTPASYDRAAPLLGEHTREMLIEFGFSADEVNTLLKADVVRGLTGPEEVSGRGSKAQSDAQRPGVVEG